MTIEHMLNIVQAHLMDYDLRIKSAKAMLTGKTSASPPFQMPKLAE